MPGRIYCAMLRTWLLRSKAALVFGITLSGGGGLPVLDVLLYHARSPTHLDRPHFEVSGLPHSHGDVCRLGSIAPYSPDAAQVEAGLPIVSVCVRGPAGLPATVPRSNELNLLPQPRAPPALPA